MIGELWRVLVVCGDGSEVKGCRQAEMLREIEIVRKEYRGGEEEIEVGLKEYG